MFYIFVATKSAELFYPSLLHKRKPADDKKKLKTEIAAK